MVKAADRDSTGQLIPEANSRRYGEKASWVELFEVLAMMGANPIPH